MMCSLFYELIQIAIGNREQLSIAPTEDDWQRLYKLSNQQALMGISFAGISRLPENQRPPSALILQWFSQSEMIKKRNAEMDEYTKKALSFFRSNSFPCVVLKGQGIAKEYGELAIYRQPGDIDIWLAGGRERIYQFSLDTLGKITGANYHHIHFPIFDKAEIEAHIYPSFLSSPLCNKALHEFAAQYTPKVGCADTPSLSFNRVFIMLHCYRHLCGHGVGLKQIMDLYFVLSKGFTEEERQDTMYWCKRLGMNRFVAASMWVMQVVFGMTEKNLLCSPDEKEGKFLLNEIMNTGNMGRADSRLKWGQKTPLGRFMANQKRNIHLLTHYPHEVCWSPFFNIARYLWLGCRGLN